MMMNLGYNLSEHFSAQYVAIVDAEQRHFTNGKMLKTRGTGGRTMETVTYDCWNCKYSLGGGLCRLNLEGECAAGDERVA
jgi:hypothetical protein